jgi:hypothetical protein
MIVSRAVDAGREAARAGEVHHPDTAAAESTI